MGRIKKNLRLMIFHPIDFIFKFNNYINKKTYKHDYKKLKNIFTAKKQISIVKNLQRKFKEPRLIGELSYEDNFIYNFDTKRKIVNKGNLSSIVVYNNNKYFINDLNHEIILKDKEFIGFKDRYLYFLKSNTYFFKDKDIIKYFDNIPELHRQPLSSFQNIISINPTNLTPFVLKYTSNHLRLIVILTEDYILTDDFFEKIDDINVLIYHNSHNLDKKVLRRKISFNKKNDWNNILKSVIIENGKREKNLLFPIFSKTSISMIEDIDLLNEKNIDGVIYLNDKSKLKKVFSFDMLIDDVLKNIDMILLKEESYYKYKTLCDDENIKKLLEFSLKDGVRYEVL
jgi:hypothetical protein